eukprot:3044475-Prymnesium_polylepis.2
MGVSGGVRVVTGGAQLGGWGRGRGWRHLRLDHRAPAARPSSSTSRRACWRSGRPAAGEGHGKG